MRQVKMELKAEYYEKCFLRATFALDEVAAERDVLLRVVRKIARYDPAQRDPLADAAMRQWATEALIAIGRHQAAEADTRKGGAPWMHEYGVRTQTPHTPPPTGRTNRPR